MGKRKGLFTELLTIIAIPLFILAIIVVVLCNRRFTNTIYGQVENELKNTAVAVIDTYDRMYPGDYTMSEDDEQIKIYKGDTEITGDNSFTDSLKEDTGIDVTLYYYNTRILTTLYEDGKRLVGTYCSSVVERDVLKGEKASFYRSVYLGEDEYFAYYCPIFNSDGKCVGMVFAGKPVEKIKNEINMNLIPLLTVILAFIVIIAFLCLRYTNELLKSINILNNFMGKIAGGDLSSQLAQSVLNRNDEIGAMGSSAAEMQKSLKKLVEQDVLTEINNRRYGEQMLSGILCDSRVSGVKFSVAIGDIDHFKSVNDTYGHECGDMVLKEVALILKKRMQSRGGVARWGGEEFLLVFYDCGIENAYMYLDMISREIREIKVPYDGDVVTVTMTFGVVEGNPDKKEYIIVKEADDRLYYGKKTGRDRIIGDDVQ